MSKLGLYLVVASAIPLLAPSGARAARGSLLVVVESAPGADVGPADVRQAIATELQSAVVAPRDPAAGDSERLLVVALDASTIRMSLRTGTNQPVTRAIPTPPERPARLRAIGWLAGNLARDQVSGIVDGPPVSPHSERPTNPVEDPSPTTQPPALQPETAPPAMPKSAAAEAAGSSASVGTVAATAGTPVANRDPQWMVSATGGPTVNFIDPHHVATPTDLGSIYQVTIQRRSFPDGLIFGAALEIGEPVYVGKMVGIAGLVGTRWEHRRWFLEANGGIGLELVRLRVDHPMITYSSSSGVSSESVTTFDQQPVLYACGIATLGVPVSRLFDLLAQLDLHVTTVGIQTDFLSASFGARLRLP